MSDTYVQDQSKVCQTSFRVNFSCCPGISKILANRAAKLLGVSADNKAWYSTLKRRLAEACKKSHGVTVGHYDKTCQRFFPLQLLQMDSFVGLQEQVDPMKFFPELLREDLENLTTNSPRMPALRVWYQPLEAEGYGDFYFNIVGVDSSYSWERGHITLRLEFTLELIDIVPVSTEEFSEEEF